MHRSIHTVRCGAFALACVTLLVCSSSTPACPPPLTYEWVQQFEAATGEGVAVDGDGFIYITGRAGTNDFFIAKCDAGGDRVWTVQHGTNDEEVATGVAVDQSGGVYICGHTSGAMPGQHNLGWIDAFVAKYSPNGEPLWVRQFGTPGIDETHAIAVSQSGIIYVAGYVLEGTFHDADAFLTAFDADGAQLWTHQFGTDRFDAASGVAVDAAGNVFLCGATYGSFDGQISDPPPLDVFVAKYDGNGVQQWLRQFGTTALDLAWSIAVDQRGGAYVTGRTSGAFPGFQNLGMADAWLAAINASGEVRWVNQYGTNVLDEAYAVAAHRSGAVFTAGRTHGASGPNSMFLASHNSDGTMKWFRQFGASSADEAKGVALDDRGNMYVVGATPHSFPGSRIVGHAFLMQWRGCDDDKFGDLNGDGAVDVHDLLILLSSWGACDDPQSCSPDLSGDGQVDAVDLLLLLEHWG